MRGMSTQRTQGILVLAGIAAPVLFSIIVFSLSSILPGYDPVTMIISKLGAKGSPTAPIMNLFGFMLSGILTILFSLGFFMAMKEQNRSIIVPALIALSGIFLILSGAFTCDPGCADVSQESYIHGVFARLSGVAFVLGMITFSYQYRIRKEWKRHVHLSMGIALASILVWSLFLFAPIDGIVGLVQRVGSSLSLVWMALTSHAVFVFRRTRIF